MDRRKWSLIGAAWVLILVAVGYGVPLIATAVAGPKDALTARGGPEFIIPPTDHPPLTAMEAARAVLSKGHSEKRQQTETRRAAAPSPPQPQVPSPASPKDGGQRTPLSQEVQPQSPAFPVQTLQFAQEAVPSDDEDAPYAVKVTIQTNVAMQPTSVLVNCDGELTNGEYHLAGVGVLMGHYWGYTKDRHGYWILLKETSFRPETPIVATLKSKRPFRVLSVTKGPPA